MRVSLIVAFLVVGVAPLGRAQQSTRCDTLVFRAFAGELSGAAIRSVTVHTEEPSSTLPVVGPILDRLHVRTRESTIRQHLLFAPGDTVDTLRVDESLRRLRALRYLGDVEMAARRCAGDPAIDLAVTTRDVMSARASLERGSAGGMQFGVTERNLLGTGREGSILLRTDQSRLGVGAALYDPWFLNGRLSLRLGGTSYRDGDEWYAQLQTPPRSVLDPFRAEVTVSRATRQAADASSGAIRRERVDGLVSQRVAVSTDAVTSVAAGVEGERTSVVAGEGSFLVGPGQVAREFAGLGLGLRRQSIRYDTLTWVLRDRGIVDVPLALEGDVLVALGRERVTGSDALHLDGWLGRAWIPSHSTLLLGDVWASGYLVGGHVAAGSVRASMLGLREARNGVWSGRVGVERLIMPDPDMQPRSLFDPTFGALPDSLRLAQSTVAASLERSIRLGARSRSWGLGLGLFAAGSGRWDAAREIREFVAVGVVGGGLRLDPTRGGRAVARLDVGFPVLSNGPIDRRPFIAISIDPFLGAFRQRSGRRSY